MSTSFIFAMHKLRIKKTLNMQHTAQYTNRGVHQVSVAPSILPFAFWICQQEREWFPININTCNAYHYNISEFALSSKQCYIQLNRHKTAKVTRFDWRRMGQQKQSWHGIKIVLTVILYLSWPTELVVQPGSA